jgi:plastocyanin
MQRICALALLMLCACTPGGIAPSSNGGGGAAATTIDVNLTLHTPASTPLGPSSGYAPPVTTVAVGTSIRFHNTDGFAHTATSIPNAATFPAVSPFGISAQTATSVSTLSGGFSTGVLPSGSVSQAILVDRAGTYLFGCFFHYSAPSNMRGIIVAQ